MSEEFENLRMPQSSYMEKKNVDARSGISKAFDEYKALLKDHTHPDNQTPAYNQRVVKTLQRLLTSAEELDSVSPGEGIFGLMVLALRTGLKLKDENVKLQKEVRDLRIEVRRLSKRK